MSKFPAVRFWHKVKIGGATECWPWIANAPNNGTGQRYGQFTWDKKKYGAHRLVCRMYHGEPEPGQVAMHRCDNTRCCNPAHLKWGSPKDNTQDMLRKNRNGHHKNCKLTDEDVATIRASSKGSTELSLLFPVSAGHIRSIKCGHRRKEYV